MTIARSTDPAGVNAAAPLQQSPRGGSGSFLVLADDGFRYWCKVLNNPQGPRVPVNEQIVARMGMMIGAPVCTPQLIYIPPALVGWNFHQGLQLEEGWAHGSFALDPVVETNALDDRLSDDNARRHAGICALYDWVGGSDPQWLVRGPDREYFSHDHGYYFPGGPNWDAASLQGAVAAAFPAPCAPAGLDAPELRRLADALEAVTQEEMEELVSNLPSAWPVKDLELQAVVSFAVDRRQPVAARLRAVAGTV